MADLVFTEGFVADVSEMVASMGMRSNIKAACELLGDFPEMGTSVVRESLVRTFGHGIRKLPVSPFIVVYEYRSVSDEVVILGLVHAKQVV